jgi:hypothetical protein
LKKYGFMKKFLLVVLGGGAITGLAIPAIAASPCVEVTAPTGIPIVKRQADLQGLDGQIVMLLGRYQPVVAGQPLRMSPLERLMLPSPAPNSNLVPTSRRNGFANIVLNDGWVVPITPRGRHRLSGPDELAKYGAQSVQIQGRARWWGGTSVRSAAGINIYLLRLACVPPGAAPKDVTPLPDPAAIPLPPPTAAPIAPFTTPVFQPDIPLDATP